MKLFVAQSVTPEQLERLRSLPGISGCTLHPDPADDEPVPHEFLLADLCFGNPPASWVIDGLSLRWVQLISVGFGEYLDCALTLERQGIQVTNLSGFFRVPVAESILGGILALYRKLDILAGLQQQKRWSGDELRESMNTLQGKSVVLVGRGAIHQQLEEYLGPFQCRIRKFGSDLDPEALDEALALADVVVCTAPATPRTDRLFDEQRLSLLPSGSLFLNFGRSNIVDTDSLVSQLQQRRLAGAVLDVTDDEPLRPDDPLWELDNVLLTQHTAGGMPAEVNRKIDLFAENLERLRAKEPLLNLVNFEKGY